MPPRQPRDRRADARLSELGERVRRLRLASHRSQEQFAQDCGLHRTYVGHIERGEINPSLLNVYRIADTLDVPIIALFQ